MDDDVTAAAERLRTLWAPGGTLDAAYGTNLNLEGQRLYASWDMETLARAYLAPAFDVAAFDAAAFLAEFVYEYRNYPNLRARTISEYAARLTPHLRAGGPTG